jgi:hypothetical protein
VQPLSRKLVISAAKYLFKIMSLNSDKTPVNRAKLQIRLLGVSPGHKVHLSWPKIADLRVAMLLRQFQDGNAEFPAC